MTSRDGAPLLRNGRPVANPPVSGEYRRWYVWARAFQALMREVSAGYQR